ncbi:MAG: acetylglutamate kinase [Cytophagales bacterium]
MKEKLFVVKIGGNVIDNDTFLNKFLAEFAQIKAHKILIHGGGKVATQIGERLGIQAQMVDGRRITDKETLEVVTMVYGGLVNKKVVSILQANNCNAAGFTGADANVIEAHKRPVKTVDYGFVGDVDAVNGPFLQTIINFGITPILAPLTHDKTGNMLNTNADTIASTVAVEMSKYYDTQLVYCFELKGVLKDFEDKDSVITHINPAFYSELKELGIISKGMIPKLDNSFDAINAGVSAVSICHADDLAQITAGAPKGTKLAKN